jgi:CRP-like cAMP-binding protein
MPLESKFQQIMRQSPLFKNLSEEDFEQAVSSTSHCQLKAGESLFRQQQPATEFFLLVNGKMKLNLLSFEGTEKVVDIINPGNTFAEAVIFSGMPGYPVNAEALEDSGLLRINAEAYSKILYGSPEACFKVMACLSVRLHWLMTELDRLTLHNVTYRLISYLLENIDEDETDSIEVALSVPKHVVASRISVTPETFSRTLKRLSGEGLLEVHDSHIVLINPVELRRLVSI